MSDSESDEENTTKYGTPLDPYEEDEIPSKKRAQREQSEQHAVDAQGRRRFHGAFTGGFSAGFGNTVGTPEGWTPSSFKSSRSEKASLANQRPEDYMDDEDRGEFGIAPRLIQTQSDFSGQKRVRQPKRFHDGPIPGEPVLEQMIRPVHETAAVRMLRAMGWRPGQGTGERLTANGKRKANESRKVYGCYMPPGFKQNSEENANEDDEQSNSDEEFDYETLFAPDDYEPYVMKQKEDRFGLGYSGLSRHSVLGNLVGEYGTQASTSSSHLVMKDKGKKVSIRGHAFGVGALEDDDEDIYAKEDLSHYDFAIGGPAEKKPQQKPKQTTQNVLKGFVRASKAMPPVKSYPPPALPRDYTPAVAGARRTRFEPTTHVPRDQGLGRHELSADARGALLGEVPLPPKPGTPTSPPPIPALAPTADVDPIAKILGRNVNFVTTNINVDEETDKDLVERTPDFIPISNEVNDPLPIDKCKVFKPFAGDPQKQLRYDRFLKGAEMEGEDTSDRLSEWEKSRERMEFEQAAKLYRPLTGFMEDRFIHGSQPDDGTLDPLKGVARSDAARGLATPAQAEAAARGLHGAATRTSAPWRPHPTLCKRFNVPDPNQSKPEQKTNDRPKLSYTIFEHLDVPVHNKDSFAKEQGQFSGSRSSLSAVLPKPRYEATSNISHDNKEETSHAASKRVTVAELFMKESEKALIEPEEAHKSEVVEETIEKFDKMELYRSIFLSDSEEEEENASNTNTKEASYTDFMDVPKNTERNTSPPKGIFANIDFDELNSWSNKAPDSEKKDNNSIVDKEANIDGSDVAKVILNDSDMYGPMLPDNIKKKIQDGVLDVDKAKDFKPSFRNKGDREVEVVDSSSSDSWVEATDSKVKKQKKKKSKHKKHKSKHKKAKRKKDK